MPEHPHQGCGVGAGCALTHNGCMDAPARNAPTAHPWHTGIAEADRGSDTLRYRGVALDELVDRVPFAHVWGLLVADDLTVTPPPAENFPLPIRTGDIRVDIQSALAQLGPVWGFRPLHDIELRQARDQLARASSMAMSFVAQSARGTERPVVPQREVDRAGDIVERFLIRWRGEPEPDQVAALGAYFVAAAEHGLSPSTVTARVIASTGADVAACLSGAVGAISGPLHGGAPSRALRMIERVAGGADPVREVTRVLDAGGRLMGFGHRVYRREDPRARLLREVCRRLGSPLFEAALALEGAALDQLEQRHPQRPIGTNMEFWAAVLLAGADVPPTMFPALFACARTAGWSAHILEQAGRRGVLRPVADYVGHPARPLQDVPSWSAMMGS